MARPSPVLPALRDRDVSPRAKRSNTSGSSSARDAGTVVGHGEDDVVVAAGRAGPWSRSCRPGCGCGRWSAGWPSTWCSRWASPVTTTGSGGRSSRQRVVRARDVGVADRVHDQPGQVDPVAFQWSPGIQAGQQQQVVDERGHPRRLGLHAAHRVRHLWWHRRRCCVWSVRRSRGSRPAGCAVRGWRRRGTGAPASRWPAGRPARWPTWPSIRFSAAPTWPTSVSGSVSCSGTRTDSATSPRSSSSSATRLAVSATRRSGRRVRRTITAPANAARSAARRRATATKMDARLVIVLSTVDSVIPETITLSRGGSGGDQPVVAVALRP